MRISVDNGYPSPVLFLAAANQPTQLAYRLTLSDVVDAFLISVLASERVLLAASYFFESEATRQILSRFPTVFNEQHAVFFINSTYPSFTEHGLGKVHKSPRSFDPYAKPRTVRNRGRLLDRIGIIGVRNDLDISDALLTAWAASCTSSDPDSVCSLIANSVDPKYVETEVIRCAGLARGMYDFIWPAIEPQILASSRLASIAPDLRRKLADLYAEVTSQTLGAIETTPSIAAEGHSVSNRSYGHLGVFQRVLAHLGIDLRMLQSEEQLLKVLHMPELPVIRRVHALIVSTVNTARQDVLDYWRGLEWAETPLRARRLTHGQMKRAITSSFQALDVEPDPNVVKALATVERALNNRFVAHLRSSVEAIMNESRVGSRTILALRNVPRVPLMAKDVLLFCSANPPGHGSSHLALDRELKEIRNALDGLHDRCLLELVYEPAFEIRNLQRIVTNHNPRFFHFSGHGTRAGEIIVEGGKAPDVVRIGPIAQMLRLIATRIECVVFNACYSAAAITEIGPKIEYAVLMSDAIGDEAALRFAEAFYGAVGSGRKIRDSFAIACAAIDLFNLPDSSIPRLYRRGVPVKRRQ